MSSIGKPGAPRKYPPARSRRRRKSGITSTLQALKAHVRNGYFVSDEPIYLPEGTGAKIVVEGSFADMDPEERAEFMIDAADVLAKLRAQG